MNYTVDALPEESHALPSTKKVTLEVLRHVESTLDISDIISLVYLMFDERHYALQQTLLRLRNLDLRIIHTWAQTSDNWRNLFIEALCIIKNYKVLEELGYEKKLCRNHFLPHIPNVSLNVKKQRKACYIMCEKLDKKSTKKLLSNYQNNWGLQTEQWDQMELNLLYWETKKYIDCDDLTSLVKTLKVIGKEDLSEMLKEVTTSRQQENDHIKVNKRIEEIDRKIEEVHQGLPNFSEPSSLCSITSNITDAEMHRKPSTSTDNQAKLNRNGSVRLLPAPYDYGKDCYYINPDNPGIVLIINQENFYTEIKKEYQHLLPPFPPGKREKLENRRGTNKDRDALKNIFERFGYTVIVKDDLYHTDIIKTIKEVANMIQNESSLFVCILSHGDKGVVYGANSCRVAVSKIQKILCTTNITHLREKPKMLILQSCQGRECQKIVEEETMVSEDEDDFSDLATDGPSRFLPPLTDLLTFWATVPGYAALRHKTNGSWFIQALCNKMEDLGNRKHFVDICTAVVNEVTAQNYNMTGMTPMINHTLRFSFYLPPIKQAN